MRVGWVMNREGDVITGEVLGAVTKKWVPGSEEGYTGERLATFLVVACDDYKIREVCIDDAKPLKQG